ncbi:LysM peptidoglycan-binding domain-containing protein [Mariniblastus sp.]|nr:LysM peptidoglycan-binding domain-containing protein [Mariniblastus sp.]
MADPFKPQSSQQLIREAKLGLSVVALLFAALIYVGTVRMTGQTPIFPFSQSVGFVSTDAMPQPPTKTVAISETAQFRKSILPRTDEAGETKPDPQKSSQTFSPPPTRPPTQPEFQFRTKPTPKPTPKPTFKVGTSNDFQPIDRRSNGGLVVAPKTKVEPIYQKFAPEKSVASPKNQKTPDSTNKDGNVIYAQFESKQFQLGNPTEPATTTTKPRKIPSFLIPPQQPVQQPASAPSIATDETPAEKKHGQAFQSFDELKTPSSFVPPELNLSTPLPPVDQPLAPRTYTTKTGDTYWSVSEKTYQDGRYFRALFRHNQTIHADYKLVSGLELKTPAKDELERRWPEECPVTSEAKSSTAADVSVETINYHVTSKGETLFEIARQKLNQASRFVELYQLNPDSLGENVQPDSPLSSGLKLRLPK